MKKEIRTNEVLKSESYKERKPDLGIESAPKQKLSQEEREYLVDKSLKKLAFHYQETAKSLGILNDHEKRSHGNNILQNDAYNDGVLSFYRCLDKFDKEFFAGKIHTTEEVFGRDQPKRLEWFFVVWAKQVMSDGLQDDLKLIRSRKVYGTGEKRDSDSAAEYVPASPEKESNAFELYTRLLNGFGGDSMASKMLSTECKQDEEFIWYIIVKKIEEQRNKVILEELMEKNPHLDINAARQKLRSYEIRLAKIFNKIKNAVSRDL